MSFLCRKSGCGPRFIMILEEPNQSLLISRVCQQVRPHAFRIFMAEPIVESLVVTIIKTLLLQYPLHVPVGFRNKKKIRKLLFDRWNHRCPIVLCRRLSRPGSPGSGKDLIQEKHCHVASHSISLPSNVGQRFNGSVTQALVEGVELQDIRPGREIWIPSARENVSAGF